jgi:hypothetical protein
MTRIEALVRRTRMLAAPALALALIGGCGKAEPAARITPRKMADSLYAVMAANRAVYAREVVGRLQDEENVIKASEHFRDDKALPLPAQMFRMGAEAARVAEPGFTSALLSSWPINKQNAARTEVEKAGLRSVAESGKAYYAEETLGGERYYTAVYADRAVTEACVGCHNRHRDSPRRDFKVGDVMGGVVIRIALK